ncbi:MAG: hypothetical protein Kow0096_20840 [Thiohalomonadaceae bacterium]
MSRTLTLLLPHILTSVQQRLPALETMLARSDRHCTLPTSLQQRLLQLAHLTATESEPPLGPLCALGDGLDASNGYWLCVEPVHLVADQDKVYLAARAESLAITAAEAAALSAEFNALYRDDGWQLFAPRPTRWYLCLPQPLQVRTVPPDGAEGCDVWLTRPQGHDALRLQAALNEIQMLFHASAVNGRRRDSGLPAINSLWLWGGAELPAVSVPWRQVHGDDCLLRGIAACSGVQAGAAGDASVLLREEGDALVLLTGEPAQLEARWFVPLLAAVRRGELDAVEIHLANRACSYRFDRRAARRWWRRRRPVAALA